MISQIVQHAPLVFQHSWRDMIPEISKFLSDLSERNEKRDSGLTPPSPVTDKPLAFPRSGGETFRKWEILRDPPMENHLIWKTQGRSGST